MANHRLTADDAYQALHDQIVDGRLKPGARLREGEIAEAMGLSRTPVREALRRLESDGLLSHEPHKGAVVRQLDYQAANELYLMREVLEGTAAALAARHMAEAELAAIYDILAAEEAVNDDPKEAARLNKVFHRALCHGAHNRYLLDMLDSLSLAMALLGQTTLSLSDRKENSLVEHRQILDAIAAHDPDTAEAAARAHIRAAHRARLKLLLDEAT